MRCIKLLYHVAILFQQHFHAAYRSMDTQTIRSTVGGSIEMYIACDIIVEIAAAGRTAERQSIGIYRSVDVCRADTIWHTSDGSTVYVKLAPMTKHKTWQACQKGIVAVVQYPHAISGERWQARQKIAVAIQCGKCGW